MSFFLACGDREGENVHSGTPDKCQSPRCWLRPTQLKGGFLLWSFLMENVFLDANAIYDAGTKAMSGSKFKYATQLFETNHLLYTAMLQKSLYDGTYTPSSGTKFLIRERSKQRYITSNSMTDKTINHLICDEILSPYLHKYLIYDNSASQIGKGVDFHRKRFEAHLHKYFMEYGNNEGYILFIDFSGYYANILQNKCLEVLEHFLLRSVENPTERNFTLWLMKKIFKTFRLDVSRFSDKEIQEMYSGKVNPMLNFGVEQKFLTGEKFLEKGVDIGNQTSQNIGIVYPYKLDNFAKIVFGIHGYGRYTDDCHAIAKTREKLLSLLSGFEVIAKEYGIIINKRKTRIVKLSGFYRYLQNGYSLTNTGKVICKISPKNITRERKRLKAYKRLLERGVITYEEIENIFRSWLGASWKRMSHRQIFNITALFQSLFGRVPKWKRKHNQTHSRLRWLMAHSSKSWD